MFRKPRLAIAAVAALSITAFPTGAGAAVYPCRVASTNASIPSGWQTVAIAGAYTAPVGATSAELTCGAVVHGITYATVTDEIEGPLAVLAGPGTVRQGLVTPCYMLRVRYPDGSSSYHDTCP